MTEPQPAHRSTLTLAGLLEVVTFGALAATMAGFLARVWWVFELATHFRPHLAVALGALLVVWMIRRRGWLAAGCALFAGINAFPVMLFLWPAASSEHVAGAQLRLVAVNVHTANPHTKKVLEFLQAANADVVLLMELDGRWVEALKPLKATHPHSVFGAREDNFGIALVSRLPMTNCNIIEFGDAGVPSIDAVVLVGDQRFHLLGTHPLPPGSTEYARMRNEQYRLIANHVRRHEQPTVVIGDLNATPWSPFFAGLLRESGLVSTSQGRGLFGSWPARLPFGRIPLDHCLVSPSIQVVNKRLGPHIGSDHLPIVVDLQLPQRDGSKPQL